MVADRVIFTSSAKREESWSVAQIKWRDTNDQKISDAIGIRWDGHEGAKACPISGFQPVWLILPEPLVPDLITKLAGEHGWDFGEVAVAA